MNNTSFLDVLSSAMIGLLIVFVAAPFEDIPEQKMRSIQVLVQPEYANAVSITGCLEIDGLINCLGDSNSVDWTASDTGDALHARWPSDKGSNNILWVGIENALNLVDLSNSSIEVLIVPRNSDPRTVTLNEQNRYQDELKLS